MRTYYFDHCASTPMYGKVIETMSEIMKLHYANSAALHLAGAEAMKLVERARASIAKLCGASPDEVLFTSGGTESNNLALKGVMQQAKRASKHIVTTAVEHSSVYRCAQQLEALGADVTYLPVDSFGRVRSDDLAAAMRPDTALVSVMHVNNETGVIQPIAELGEIVKRYPQAKFHVDGVQALGKLPSEWSKSGIDLYAGSAHKFGGPKGVGFLLVRNGIELAPLLAGGSQEQGVRGGTHNVPGIVGMAQALRLAVEGMAERGERMYKLRRKLLEAIDDIPELVVNGFGAEGGADVTAPHVVNVSYPGMRPEVLVHMLEEHGVLISTQSACSSKSLQPSRVLLAMGFSAERASGGIRISFGEEHTEADIEELVARLKKTVAKLKPLEGSRK